MAGPQAAGNAGGYLQHTPDSLGLDFEDAERPNTKARIALNGPSGAGKTYTALQIATGMGGTIGVIDTERGSAANYAGLFTFKHLRMPNTRPQTLVQALAVAAQRRIEVVIIDSMTHFWSGKGGILDQVDSTTSSSRSNNAFTTGWKSVKPVEQEMWEAILSYPGHVIVTIRVKTAYEIQEKNGKKEPVKIGLKPDQREGADYEFDLVGDLNLQHVMRISKSRYPGTIDVNDEIPNPNTELGQAIVSWLDEGVTQLSVQDYVDLANNPATSREELRRLHQQELPKRGLLGAALIDPMTGSATTLGALIVRAGLERKAIEEATAGAAAPVASEPHPPTGSTPHSLADAEDAVVPDPAPAEQQTAPGDFQVRVIHGWDHLEATQMALVEAREKDLLKAQMPGPDGQPYVVEKLLADRVAELIKQRQELRNDGGQPAGPGVYEAAGITGGQNQRGAA